MKSKIIISISLLALAACSGAPVQKVEIEKPQFKVTDAAPGGREAWLDNPNLYADKEGLDTKDYLYYTGDAQSADKRMACEKAQADVIDDVARQVSVFVNSSIARAASDSTSSDSTGISASSASSTETSKLSSQLSKTLVAGIEKHKQYWEQRNYSEVGGAKSIYYCWVLGKVSKKTVDQMIDRAKNIRFKEDPNLKEKVEGKLGNLQSEFKEYMQAH
jgi:hypothetical protein